MNNLSQNGLSKTAKTIVLLFSTGFVFIIYILRLFSMQITNGEEYKTQSKTISSQISTLPASRGEIYDRNADMPLVINNDSFAVEVTPGEIPSSRYDTVMVKLAGYLGITKEAIDQKIPKNIRRSYSSVQIKTNVPFTVISNIDLYIVWQLLIGFVLLFALIYSLYEIYGRHLVKKGYQKKEGRE